MTEYKVTLDDGQTFLFSGNMTEANAPIRVNFHDWENEADWQQTPFQTADARHYPVRAAELLAEYFASDADDCTDISSIEAID